MKSANALPLVPIRNTVVFPKAVVSLTVGRSRSLRALKGTSSHGGEVILALQRSADEDDPSFDGIYHIGTRAHLESIEWDRSGAAQIVVRGLSRFQLSTAELNDGYFQAWGEDLPDAAVADSLRMQAFFNNLRTLVQDFIELNPGPAAAPLKKLIAQVDDPVQLGHLCISYLNVAAPQKQTLLEIRAPEARLEQILSLMVKEREILRLQRQIHEKMTEHMGQAQREAILREQIRTIKEELGEKEDSSVKQLRQKIEQAGMKDGVLKVALEELKRFEGLSPHSPDYHVTKSYLEWLASMPWAITTPDQLDLTEARRILDEDHYGLETIKKRVLQNLAVARLKNNLRGPILCLVGPPGVGKTSLGQSIARVLGKKFVRVSLGGVRDEAEIRGHRRTYVGAMPGRIIQGLKRAQTKNPLFMLDEIDKLGASFQGDPSASLLEVLDPEQNNSFVDHYLDVPFDLSQVFFVATANMIDSIPGPLRDRLEIITLPGYTTDEKKHIARRHILPRLGEDHGLKADDVDVTAEGLELIIHRYTREAGVRELKRQLATLFRAAAEKVVEGSSRPIRFTASDVEKALGPPKFDFEVVERVPKSGVVTGLAWTPQGGEILFIEATSIPGKGQLQLTGQLGDVMKESAQIAWSVVRSLYGADAFPYAERDVHVHVPGGAIPKDGPSAGVALLVTLASLVSGRTVDPRVAMTGEITLRGVVLPVGGIKEKILAAHRAGIKTVILPKRNQKDLAEVPEEVKRDLTFVFAGQVSELLEAAFDSFCHRNTTIPATTASPVASPDQRPTTP